MIEPGRVLIVDDDDIIREALRSALEDAGLAVRTADHGKAALETLDMWRPDLILLDLMMPVMDGWAFREAQRAHPAAARIPVIVLSAARGLAELAESLRPAQVIPKPFELEDPDGSAVLGRDVLRVGESDSITGNALHVRTAFEAVEDSVQFLSPEANSGIGDG
jgi:CheY-like chemotaxis protein